MHVGFELLIAPKYLPSFLTCFLKHWILTGLIDRKGKIKVKCRHARDAIEHHVDFDRCRQVEFIS